MPHFCTVYTVKSGLYIELAFVTRFKIIMNIYTSEKRWNSPVRIVTDCGVEDQSSNPCTSRNFSLYGSIQTA